MAEIRSLLTYCQRGERFCGGHWGGMIAGGRVLAILRRLAALRETVDPEHGVRVAGGMRGRDVTPPG